MGTEDIIKIFIFLLGSTLQIATLILMAKRKGNKKREIMFAFFTFSVFCWSFGIFTSLFCGYLYREVNIVEQHFGTIAIYSFPVIFPLLAHSLLNFIASKYNQPRKIIKYPTLLLIYLPTLMFIHPLSRSLKEPFPILERLQNFIASDSLFLVWQFALLTIAWYMIVHLCRQVEVPEERRSLGMVGWGITVLLTIYFFTFVLQGRFLYAVGPYLVLGTEAITCLIPPLFAYYLYCYNYMEYLLKRSLIYCVLGIFVISFYLSVIRPMGEAWEKKFQINFRMIEGILVMGLVFFFDPLKKSLHELSNRIFFSERQYYRTVFSEISTVINQSSYMDVTTLLTYVASTISRAMKIREVTFMFFKGEKENRKLEETTANITLSDLGNIVSHIEKRRMQVLNIYDLGEDDTEVLREMRKIRVFTIIPIYNEGSLIGLLNLGRRIIRHQLLAEEEEMLLILINQIVTALENTRLAREKFAIERRMYENEKLSSLGRLSASIAHEVKNPLSSIKTIAQVMKEEISSDDPNHEGLTLIVEEVNRLSRVVKQLLLFARPYNRALTRVNMSEVLHNVLLLLRHEAERNNVVIKNMFEQELWLVSDRDALSEIFFNLLHNSIQAMPQGGEVTICYGTEANEEKGEAATLKIRVADTGPGIAPADRDKIFAPFYTTKQTGTGLGLAIVRDRVQKLNGKIILADDYPGAVFEIFFPMPSGA
jgi:signal transduction histidine kinase